MQLPVRVSIVLSAIVALASGVQAVFRDPAFTAAVHAGVAAVALANAWICLLMSRLTTETAIATVHKDVERHVENQQECSRLEPLSLQSRVEQPLSVLAPLINEVDKCAQVSVQAMEHASVIAQGLGR